MRCSKVSIRGISSLLKPDTENPLIYDTSSSSPALPDVESEVNLVITVTFDKFQV